MPCTPLWLILNLFGKKILIYLAKVYIAVAFFSFFPWPCCSLKQNNCWEMEWQKFAIWKALESILKVWIKMEDKRVPILLELPGRTAEGKRNGQEWAFWAITHTVGFPTSRQSRGEIFLEYIWTNDIIVHRQNNLSSQGGAEWLVIPDSC